MSEDRSNLKVLSIGSDPKLFEEGSVVAQRIKEYGQLVTELHIVHMCDKGSGLVAKQLSENVWIYPTNSSHKLLKPIDAARIGKKLIFERQFVRGQSIITAQDLESGWAGARVKSKWRIPLEVQFHTDVMSPYFKGFQNFVRKSFLNSILTNADSIRVVSTELGDRLRALTKAHINVLPIWIDKAQIEERPVKFDLHTRYPWHFIILVVARLTTEKNVALALEIMQQIRARTTEAGLVIVGSGPEENNLKSLVKKLKLDDAVSFAGWQDDLTSFYKTANLFLQTSLFEGYGMALVEAGISGLPVVTTPVGIAKELENGRDAYIIDPKEKEIFVAAIIDLIDHNFKRDGLRINMKHALENKLISKENFLMRMRAEWVNLAQKVS